MLAGCERTLEACHRRRLRSHAFGNLCLGKPGAMPGPKQQVEERAFVALDACNFFPNARPTHELGDYLIMGSHV